MTGTANYIAIHNVYKENEGKFRVEASEQISGVMHGDQNMDKICQQIAAALGMYDLDLLIVDVTK